MATTTRTTKALSTIGDPSNDGASAIEVGEPYRVLVEITGSAALLLHGWSVDAIAEKAAAAKNSTSKKTDNLESYIHRDDAGMICLPGEYLRQSLIGAARYQQDPRSPRKSAMDLYKAGVVCLTELASLGCADWDYVDRRRVTVMRAGITRQRPAFNAGWKTEVVLLVLTPEYLNPQLVQRTITDAGRLIGVGDFRPTFGRFQITRYQVLEV